MDYEDIANLSNLTFDKEVTSLESRRFIAHEIVFAIFCTVAIFADTVIIYTIFRFTRLRTVANVFLANWAIADLCSLLVAPSGYRIISVIDGLSLSHEFMCSLFESGVVLHTAVILFVILVTIDWLLGAYFPRVSEKFRNHYRHVIATVWIVILLGDSIAIGFCMAEEYAYATEMLLLCVCSALLLLVIVLQSCRGVQKCKRRPLEYPTLMLTLASAFVLSYILAFLHLVVVGLIGYHHPLLAIISAIVMFSSSIINFCLLYYFNKDFQACFLQVIRRTGGRYEESLFDDNTPNGVSYENDNIRVSFHRPTEELLTNEF